MLISLIFLLTGFALLWKGGDYLLDGSTGVANHFKVSDFLIGLTLVAFGTSAPELVVSLIASFQNKSDIIFGNLLGSNIANILLILGITSIVAPITISKSSLKKEWVVSILGILLLFLLVNTPFDTPSYNINFYSSLFLLLGFCLFLFISTRSQNNSSSINKSSIDTSSSISISKSLIYFIVGILFLPLGGHFTIKGAVSLASGLGISELIISIFAVAIGTSLPELATCLLAAHRQKSSLIIGNILGSNIFNILFVLGTVGLFNTLSFSPSLNYEICVIILSSILFCTLTMMRPQFKLVQWQGLVLLSCYIIYCYQLFFS